MPSVRLTWRCKRDVLSCPVCRALDGYTWKFTTEKGEKLPDVLVHPVYGAVWSIKEDSLIKEENGKCRCEITREFDLSDMVLAVRKIRDKLAAKYGSQLEPKTLSREKIPDKQYEEYLKVLFGKGYISPEDYTKIMERRNQKKNSSISNSFNRQI